MIYSLCRYSVNSEYKHLKVVLLHKPGPEIEQVDNPTDVLHIRKVDYKRIEKEYEQIINLYKRLRIKVYLIDCNRIGGSDKRCLFNMMYTRDLLFMIPKGPIMAKMKFDVRRDEVKYAERALRSIGVHVRNTIEGEATFEGADALWVNSRLVVVGVGNRTNTEGFSQVRDELKIHGMDCVSVPAPRYTTHLLGVLQFVDSDLALVRVDLADLEIIDLLKRNKIDIVNIPENDEVKERQAMNIVTVTPKEIIMPADCPKTRKIYRGCGIKIVAEVKINQLINGRGGLACATAVLDREG